MKKILLSLFYITTIVFTVTSCGTKQKEIVSENIEKGEGKEFNIYAWNEEFKGFFETYYQVPEGIKVNWIINPSDNGVYQDKLDEALINQANLPDNQKVDMFLAEADYILKYVDSDATADVRTMGVTDISNMYSYTVQAATSTEGKLKGVSFQCCPSALIYRRSIAKEVLGTDNPEEVQAALSDWNKFNEVAKEAKNKGYYMTASEVATYRVFSNNASSPWVDNNNNLTIPKAVEDWISQAELFTQNGYTLIDDEGVWGDTCTGQMFNDGKTMCYFGPAWYFNFSMGNAQDKERGCFGDWGICEGPQAHFWGGTWMLAANGTDNPEMVADVMNFFTNNTDTCEKLVKEQAQFSNNKSINNKFANDASFGNEFLGGQNDIDVFSKMTGNINFKNNTMYDQLLNEGLQDCLRDYFKGIITKEAAMNNFYKYINEKYPAIKTP